MLGINDFIENTYHSQIQSKNIFPKRKAEFRDFPQNLSPQIKQQLNKNGIGQLFSHQYEAFESISNYRDSLIVSETASGKSLAFFLPILNEYSAASQPFSTLLLYPTKALSRDQEGNLGKLVENVLQKRNIGTFDGDTPRETRSLLQDTADFVITNPDMLHNGILPGHNRKWRGFLSRLKFIVVDEVHIYRGAFGSHVSNVFRRLIRICQHHGSNPVFICSSATIGNAAQHAKALFHRDFVLIKKDGSSRPHRTLYTINPQLSRGAGGNLFRKGPASISVGLIRKAASMGIRTICFCRARQEVERLYRAVCDNHPSLAHLVKPYRGGLLPNERRKLEQDLFNGKIKVILSTNALELGIDIGDLDLCILSGHPGSMASFWQQAGRVGRKGNQASIVFIAKDSPVDQYLVRHPDFITAAPIERAWLSADNPYIIMQHIPCMAYEHPISEEEELFTQNLPFKHSLHFLKSDGSLKEMYGVLRYNKQDYPARGVNLRGMTDYNVDIYCGTKIIGEIDPIGARGSLYKDAIYQHLGKKYISMDLDLNKKICKVEPIAVDYYTEAVWEKRLSMNDVSDEKIQFGHIIQFGYLNINKQPKIYKKIRERSFENVGYGPITLPAFEYDTTGMCILPCPQWKKEMEKVDKRFVQSALHGLAYILKRVAPSLCMADVSDMETDVALAVRLDKEWKSALYLYDTIEGGVGYGEKVYELLPQSLELCLNILGDCPCKTGCPSCVPPIPPGVENEELMEFLNVSNAAVECTRCFLISLLKGAVEIPKIQIFQESKPQKQPQPEENEEIRALEEKLARARALLIKKRERVY